MPFELCNASNTFISNMNQILKPYTNNFVVVYFDDILIHSKSEADHINHVKAILQ